MTLPRAVIFAILLLVVIVAVACVWYIQNTPPDNTGLPEALTVGDCPVELSALFYIAQDQEFFTSNSLNLTVRSYSSGRDAVVGLLANETDLSFSSEFILVENALDGRHIQTIASIDKSEDEFLIARKSRGIETPQDLKGKTVGIPRGTSAEFYLGRFLNLHDIALEDVTIVDLNPNEVPGAMAEGKIDATLVWEPHASLIIMQLGSDAAVWPAQSDQVLYWLVIGRDDWISSHPVLIERFLYSLSQAETYYLSNPDDAKAIVKVKLGCEDAYMDRVWPENQFMLSLDQSLILAMEDESRWMIANDLTSAKEVPNFLDNIYVDGLLAISPESVNIII